MIKAPGSASGFIIEIEILQYYSFTRTYFYVFNRSMPVASTFLPHVNCGTEAVAITL
jgi:hypothetical protein